jgi:hypothetical protein
VVELQTPTAHVTSVTFGGSETNPIVTVKGTGFQTSRATNAPGCAPQTGEEYNFGDLYLSDTNSPGSAQPWGAGFSGDCIGLTVSTSSATQVVFGLGSFYGGGTGGFQLNSGDSYTIGVDGTTTSGTVSYGALSSALIGKLSPTSGAGGAKTPVTITGTGFTGTKAVYFGSNAATSVVVKSATEITCVAPTGTGQIDVTLVSNTGQTSKTNKKSVFRYLAPTITSISPATGSTSGGTKVTITGTNFQGATAVSFGSNTSPSIKVKSATQIVAYTPAASSKGKVDVTVTAPGGTSSQTITFKYTG